MTYEDRIREAYPSFSKSFARLADFLLDSYLEAAFMTATELGHAINVDATTVVRFSQQLGYTGYPELLREIREKIKSQLLAQPQKTAGEDSLDAVVEMAMRELDSLFEQTRRLLDSALLGKLVEGIGRAEKIILFPDPAARAPAQTLQSSLERGGFLVVSVEPDAPNLARTLRMVAKGDLFIAFQSAPESNLPVAGLREAHRAGASTAAILGAASFNSAAEADLAIFAYSQPSDELTGMILNAIAFTIGQALRWRYPDRYTGADAAIEQLVQRIRKTGE